MPEHYCMNDECHYNDSSFENNCSAPESVSNSCEDADWSDDEEIHEE